MVVAVLGVLAVVAVNAFARKVGVVAPLALVAVGIAASWLPIADGFHLDPEWILAGVLPPLLYSAAVSMPTMEFRRDFGTIGGLSVTLVVITSVVLGLIFSWLVPGVGLAMGIALGAVISPTDAVATGIVKRLGATPRVVTVLEGESLLNDASALVILRSAIVAVGASVSLGHVALDFGRSVVIAVLVGLVVGYANLRARGALKDTASSTAISFVVPFVASVPAEHLGASGLVAAVTAGLVTGQGSARYLRAQQRLAETSNWSTIELLLEGGVFLTMGLQLSGLLDDVREAHDSAWTAVWLGALAILVTIVLRTGYVAAVLWSARHQLDPDEEKERLAVASERIAERTRRQRLASEGRGADRARRSQETWALRVTRRVADIDYLARSPLRRREGAVLVWAGMRGAVTVAAAQTLPESDVRDLLVLVAFVAAAGSLLVQGGTLGWLVRSLDLGGAPQDAEDDERARLLDAMAGATLRVVDDPDLRRSDGTPFDAEVLARTRARAVRRDEDDPRDTRALSDELLELRLRIIDAQRDILLEARSTGTFSSAALSSALDVLDADQISAELKGGRRGDER
ncbi:sodium:proton antiporter [Cellulomonas sp. HZM]|uniref:cation:proton antiporter n=1 Tax=Cellulomonas sp. HZM TaxID=1454010 RepID=UPI0004938874|nr:sodium:proton antiporter [Cellulomonas sp. HZM]